jgi:hypothetical protein
MPDKLYEWLEQFQMFMDRGSFGDLLLVVVLGTLGAPLVILVHELGHALAVRARGLPLHGMKVGDETVVTVTAGNFRVELGPLLGKGEVGGYVLYDGRAATPLDALGDRAGRPGGEPSSRRALAFDAPRTSHISATTCSPISRATQRGPLRGGGALGGDRRRPLAHRRGLVVDDVVDLARRPAPDGRLVNVLSVDVADGAVQRVHSILNPDKLGHLGPLSDVALRPVVR